MFFYKCDCYQKTPLELNAFLNQKKWAKQPIQPHTSQALLNCISNLFCNHVHRSHRQAWGQKRKHRRICHSQVFNPNNPTLRIHNRHLIVWFSHLACRASVVHGVKAPLNMCKDLVVGRDVETGVVFWADRQILGQYRGLEDLTQSLESRDDDFDVRGVGEPVGVDEGLIARARGGDGDIPAGERRDGGEHYGTVLIAVIWCVFGWKLEVADPAGKGEVLELRPVRGEGGEI